MMNANYYAVTDERGVSMVLRADRLAHHRFKIISQAGPLPRKYAIRMLRLDLAWCRHKWRKCIKPERFEHHYET